MCCTRAAGRTTPLPLSFPDAPTSADGPVSPGAEKETGMGADLAPCSPHVMNNPICHGPEGICRKDGMLETGQVLFLYLQSWPFDPFPVAPSRRSIWLTSVNTDADNSTRSA